MAHHTRHRRKPTSRSLTLFRNVLGAFARDLSRQRADAVAQALRERTSGLTLRVGGRGSADPIAPNTIDGQDNPAGRTRNRRVEITFTG